MALFSVMARSVKSTPPISSPSGGMMTSATSEPDYLAESRADDDTHGHVYHVAAHREFLEFL